MSKVHLKKKKKEIKKKKYTLIVLREKLFLASMP